MYNNFSSKKTKKVISALLASALVVTSAPITADAATTKAVGVGKTFKVTKTTKVSGLSKSEKNIVSVSINKKKKTVTVKGKKAGSASFKIGSKSYNVKVVSIKSIKKKSFATTLTAKKNKDVSAVVSATNAKYDTFTWTSDKTSVVKVSKSSTKMDSKKIVKNTLKPLKKGSATITVKSKATGKKLSVKVNVKAASTTTPAPSASTPTATPSAAPTGTPSATPASTPAVSATPAPTETASGSATATPAPTETASGSATATPVPTATTAPTDTPITASASAVSAAAVNVRTIAVTFDRNLTKDEQADLKVSVTRDKATQSVKSAFKDDKTLYITRDSETAFAAATYNVTLSGSVNAAYEVKFAGQEAKSLDITSSVIVDGEKEAAVKVSLLDQYGEEMSFKAGDFDIVATNKTQSNANVSGKVSVTADGKLVINTENTDTNKDTFKTDDEIQITLLHKSGLSSTKVLKVVESTSISNITLNKTPELPTGVTRLTKNSASATAPVKIYYTATNNYGETVELQEGEFTKLSTNPDVLDAATVTPKKDAAGKTYFEIKGFKDVGKTSFVVMANGSGTTDKIDLEVLENAGEVYAAEYETTSVEVAKGSKIAIGVTLTDRYGDKVEAKNAVGKVAAKASVDNVTATFDTTSTSDTYGKLVIDASNGDVKEDSTIIVTATVNNVPTVITVKIGKKAVPSNFTATAAETTLVVGSSTVVTCDVKDQYGSSVTSLNGYTLKAATGTAVKAYTVSGTSIIVTGSAVGTHDLKIDLVKDDTKAVQDTKTVSLSVVANTAENLTFATEAIPTLYKNGSEDVKNYGKEVVVTAKTSNGTKVSLPADSILSVTSDSKYVDVKKVDGKYYLVGKDDAADKLKEDVTANISIVVRTDDGSTILKTTATVSKDDVKFAELKVYGTDDKETSSLSTGTYTSTAIGKIEAIDQFGGKTTITKANIDAISLSFAGSTGFENTSDDTAEYEAGKLVIKDKNNNTKVAKDSTFKATFVVGALTKTVDVTVTAVYPNGTVVDTEPSVDVEQIGSEKIVSGTAATVTYSAITKNIAEGTQVNVKVSKVSDEGSENDIATPAAISGCAIGNVGADGKATIVITSGKTVEPGKYTVTLTFNGNGCDYKMHFYVDVEETAGN